MGTHRRLSLIKLKVQSIAIALSIASFLMMGSFLDRRRFLLSLSALGVASASSLAAPPLPRLSDDFGPLKRVVVLTPRAADHEPTPEFGDTPIVAIAGDDLLRLAQHKQFVDLLQSTGAKVLHLDQLLDAAIAQASRYGRFHGWVAHMAPWLVGKEDDVDGRTLIETGATALDALGDDLPPPLEPLRSMFFTRDIAAMTPQGLVLSSFINEDRAPEVALLRFALAWSPELKSERVAFDSYKAGVNIQGGDIIVADAKTIFLGVGNLTDASAAPKLARSLKMDVVAVALPGIRSKRTGSVTLEGWNGLRTRFLHLDTVLSFVGPKKCLTLPYVFEAAYQDRANLKEMIMAFSGLDDEDDLSPAAVGKILAEVGRLKVYQAGTGNLDKEKSGKKLVDHLRIQGYEPSFVGGVPPRPLDASHLRERVIPELENQAANVVILKPGRALAYAGNTHTVDALRKGGLAVDTFAATSLARWHGGPHCLTLPLEREIMVDK